MKKNKILCPVDFSDESIIAAKYAHQVAKKTNAELILFHSELFGESDENIQREKLNELSVSLNERETGTTVSIIPMVENGLLPTSIRDLVKKESITLLIMSTSGDNRKTFQGIHLKSNASAIVEEIECPAIIIPENYDYKEIVNIFCAIDLNHYSMDYVRYASNFSKSLGASITFLYVTDNQLGYDKIREFELIFQQNFPIDNVAFKVVGHVDVIEALKNLQIEEKIDLLILAKLKRGIIEKLYAGKVTEKMVYNSFLPLLITGF